MLAILASMLSFIAFVDSKKYFLPLFFRFLSQSKEYFDYTNLINQCRLKVELRMSHDSNRILNHCFGLFRIFQTLIFSPLKSFFNSLY